MTDEQLIEHRAIFDRVTLKQLFADDPERALRFTFESAGVRVDLSKNLLTNKTLSLLTDWAEERGVLPAIDGLFAGDQINPSEGRSASHPKLRDLSQPDVQACLQQMEGFVDRVRRGDWLGKSGEPITDIVTLGIGGSDLGGRMVVDALSPYRQEGPACHFVANLDSVEFDETVAWLNPFTTLFIVASKSFSTRETMLNADRASKWLAVGGIAQQQQHFVAVTANPSSVEQHPIYFAEIFQFDMAVGGRFSLWSAIGLPIALSVGMDNFKELLSGAASMDAHFQSAPLTENIPVMLGLIDAWYIDYWGTQSRAVLPYVHGLRGLPGYLRQLEMESNGKSVTKEGTPVELPTSGVVWGASGAIGQHSFSQMLHQGKHLVPVEFISVLGGYSADCGGYTELFANCLAQSRVLMTGKSRAEVERELQESGLGQDEIIRLAPHKVMTGNRPSTTILLDSLSPQCLGALLAMYEHKVYVQSVLWGVNAFDQWGVEYGKQVGSQIYQLLKEGGHENEVDGSTAEMIRLYRKRNSSPFEND